MSTKEGAPPPAGKSLGPVSDLERHLPAEWSGSLFNSLYQTAEGEGLESDAATVADIDALVRNADLEPGDRILLLGCGAGGHCLELARRGYGHVTGIDRSRYLIRLARKNAARAAFDITFHQGDPRRFPIEEGGFHCVALLGNTFAYFDREDDETALLETAKRALHSGGDLVLDLADGEWMRQNFEKRSWHWIDQNHFVCRERSLAHDGERLVSREVVVHAEKGVIADQFYAERLHSRAGIAAKLEAAGFVGVRFDDPSAAGTARPREPGGALPRLFLTARAPHKAPLVRLRRPAFPDVAVILGDPGLPDDAKIEGRFRPEDYEAVARMKTALAEHEDYRFTFLDNHTSLLSDLRGDPPAFVLNFCDTGYHNDAFRELHVPALLELLDIPYSGAGPTCLGLCYDKALVRAVAAAHDIPVPLETYCDIGDQAATIPSVFPALIKPSTGDGSVGITRDSVVHDAAEAVAYLHRLSEELPGRAALIQEYLTGPEYGVGLIGNPGRGFTVLPPLEVDYSDLEAGLPRILSYESKADPDSPYWNQIKYRQARIDEATRRRLVDYAAVLFERLGCRDYGRFDFRADAQGEIKLLEVNPNPAWCWDGKLNMMAGFAGYGYADLLRLMLEAAQERVAARRGAEVGSAAVSLASR